MSQTNTLSKRDEEQITRLSNLSKKNVCAQPAFVPGPRPPKLASSAAPAGALERVRLCGVTGDSCADSPVISRPIVPQFNSIGFNWLASSK